MPSLIIKGTPMPKKRPRVRRDGRTYTPRETESYENLVAYTARAEGIKLGDVPVTLAAHFHMPTRRKVDGDNLLKALLDGLEKGGAFDDDKQVTQVYYEVHHCSKHPHTLVVLHPRP